MPLLDWLTLLSYVALNVDVILETRRIYRTKSSNDLSLFGMLIRYIAIIIVLIKFVSLHDPSLVIGQALIAFTFTLYLALAVVYFRHRKPVNKRKK